MHDDTCGSNHFPILPNNIKPTGGKIPRWKLDKANWEEFEEKCKEKLTHIQPNNDIIEYFTETLNSIAIDCIPRNATPNKQNIPWFNNKCLETIRRRKAALKIQKEPTTSNLIEYKLNRAKARKEIKAAKRKCWQNYVNKLNCSTKPKVIKERIRRIASKQQTISIKHLSKDNSIITDKKNYNRTVSRNFL